MNSLSSESKIVESEAEQQHSLQEPSPRVYSPIFEGHADFFAHLSLETKKKLNEDLANINLVATEEGVHELSSDSEVNSNQETSSVQQVSSNQEPLSGQRISLNQPVDYSHPIQYPEYEYLPQPGISATITDDNVHFDTGSRKSYTVTRGRDQYIITSSNSRGFLRLNCTTNHYPLHYVHHFSGQPHEPTSLEDFDNGLISQPNSINQPNQGDNEGHRGDEEDEDIPPPSLLLESDQTTSNSHQADAEVQESVETDYGIQSISSLPSSANYEESLDNSNNFDLSQAVSDLRILEKKVRQRQRRQDIDIEIIPKTTETQQKADHHEKSEITLYRSPVELDKHQNTFTVSDLFCKLTSSTISPSTMGIKNKFTSIFGKDSAKNDKLVQDETENSSSSANVKEYKENKTLHDVSMRNLFGWRPRTKPESSQSAARKQAKQDGEDWDELVLSAPPKFISGHDLIEKKKDFSENQKRSAPEVAEDLTSTPRAPTKGMQTRSLVQEMEAIREQDFKNVLAQMRIGEGPGQQPLTLDRLSFYNQAIKLGVEPATGDLARCFNFYLPQFAEKLRMSVQELKDELAARANKDRPVQEEIWGRSIPEHQIESKTGQLRSRHRRGREPIANKKQFKAIREAAVVESGGVFGSGGLDVRGGDGGDDHCRASF